MGQGACMIAHEAALARANFEALAEPDRLRIVDFLLSLCLGRETPR